MQNQIIKGFQQYFANIFVIVQFYWQAIISPK